MAVAVELERMPKKTQSTPFWLFTLTGCSPCLFWTRMCLAKAAQLCLHLRWLDSLCMTMFGEGKRWQEILRPCGCPNIFKMAAAYDGLEYKLCIKPDGVCVCLVVSFHLDIQLKFYIKTWIDSAHFWMFFIYIYICAFCIQALSNTQGEEGWQPNIYLDSGTLLESRQKTHTCKTKMWKPQS